MKRNVTDSQLLSTVVSLSDTRREKAVASSPFGPVRAGLTTLQITQRVQPMESGSYSVKQAKIIEFKYSEVCVTLRLDTEQEGAAKLLPSTLDTTGTDVLE